MKQKFKGKDSSGRYISVETTINGTMPDISTGSDVRMDPFKEVYRREDRGKVESEGTVTFQVDGEANGFSVLQTIEYDELRGCDDSFYSFDVESRVLLTKYDPIHRYASVAIQSFIVNASTPDSTYGSLIDRMQIELDSAGFVKNVYIIYQHKKCQV